MITEALEDPDDLTTMMTNQEVLDRASRAKVRMKEAIDKAGKEWTIAWTRYAHMSSIGHPKLGKTRRPGNYQ